MRSNALVGSMFVSGIAAAATSLSAQQSNIDVFVNWHFVEVVAGTNTPVANPNGVLEPGEAARIVMSIEFSPPVGTLVTYPPPPGPGVGTVAGLGGARYDLASATPGWQGTWTHFQRRPEWALGSIGSPAWNGNGIEGAQVGQFPLPGTVANPENPIPDIWSAVWTPADFSARVVRFASFGQIFELGASVYVQYGTDPTTNAPLYITARTQSHHGYVEIPIIPAPGTGGLVLGLLLLGSRRRR
jgi:hypothetical protein